jgi:hypothetical protein
MEKTYINGEMKMNDWVDDLKDMMGMSAEIYDIKDLVKIVSDLGMVTPDDYQFHYVDFDDHRDFSHIKLRSDVLKSLVHSKSYGIDYDDLNSVEPVPESFDLKLHPFDEECMNQFKIIANKFYQHRDLSREILHVVYEASTSPIRIGIFTTALK